MDIDDSVGAKKEGEADHELESSDMNIADGERGAPLPAGSTQTEAATEGEDETARLHALGAGIRDQDDLERNIGAQANQLMTEQANEREQKRLGRAKADREKLLSQVRRIRMKLNQPVLPGAASVTRMQNEADKYLADIAVLDQDIKDIEARIKQNEQDLEKIGSGKQEAGGRLPGESQRDFLIRTGKITPFSRLAQPTAKATKSLKEALFDAEQDNPEAPLDSDRDEYQSTAPVRDQKSHRHLVRPGIGSADEDEDSDEDFAPSPRPAKRRKLASRPKKEPQREHVQEVVEDFSSDFQPDPDEDAEENENENENSAATSSEEEMNFEPGNLVTKSRRGKISTKGKAQQGHEVEDLTGVDDGNESLYQSRLERWVTRRSEAREKQRARQEGLPVLPEDDEWHLPHPTQPDWDVEGGYKLPGDVHPALFDYQKTGVQWLWELYSQQVGGIVGDEMGLGKTIQIIAFLAGLQYSKKISKPVIVICPATVMKQWVNEFHTWWPAFRVSILHTSGSGMIDVGRESRREEELINMSFAGQSNGRSTRTEKAASRIINRVVEEGHILVTTYSGLQSYAEYLIPVDWGYAVLDEGHNIRNPNASVTIHCKELRTPNRVILSGTPMQNNLVELWSLFDFVFPMRLGTLVNFRSAFEIPIRQGGYANASNLQVQTANKCAETLKDSISPYLLQRLKMDVAADLPRKTEQVLFCKLTKSQRSAYEGFLGSDEMKSILAGRRQMLYGIDILRKICNHPDLADHKVLSHRPGYKYGEPSKSGKMMVVKELLDIWSKGGHKTLLFAQHRIMLDILEFFVKSITGIEFRRMDGTTPISLRQTLVDEFNTDPGLHVFLLTTRVGGLGVNLTGADRVIIFDPDWNPSTDIQARERAWRLGQKREVQIYRLMVAGTIEEKIFHRQIFKQFLTNKILKDPKQRQTFQMKDLHDLFTLGGDDDEGGTETGKLFKGTETKIAAEKEVEPNWGGERDELSAANNESGRTIGDIRGIASIQNQEDAETKQTSSEGEGAAEQRIMAGIFARSGVSSTLEHDQIINGKKVLAADPKIIEKEARRVAAEAAKSLKDAEKVARATPIGVPTWTGEVGQGGRPPTPPPRRGFGIGGGVRGGPSSAGVLANLQSHRLPNGDRSRSSTPGASRAARQNAKDQGPKGKEFLQMIRDYMLAHGSRVYTQMLIDHFNHYCKTEARTAEFKAMLRELATLEKGHGGRGRWILKEEYKK